ncbi:MAG: glycoside hydrolase family 2 TIM barrel-domain containing protein [Bacteroidota bacterium]
MNKLNLLFLLLLSFFSGPLSAQTTIEKVDDQWQLLVDWTPYEIKGATFGYDHDVEQYDAYFKELQFLGVNTIRTWAAGEHTGKLLDAAHKNNIKVLLGIWMRHGRPGMEDDDQFNYLTDQQGKEDMYNNALKVVDTYKNHPAILAWGVGNEVYLNMATDEEKLAYSQLLERICSAIKKEDSQHLILSVEAWTFGLVWWEQHVPSLDIYGLNTYGPGAHFIADELYKKGIDKPYIITEFGVTGEWDIEQEINGVKVEPSDQQKYEAITIGYKDWISNKPANLGVFVFHYSTSTAFLGPWLLTHYDSMTRPQYWAIREAFTGKKPINSVPVINDFSLALDSAQSGTWIPVKLETEDLEQEIVDISFRYNQRTGSRKRRNQINALAFRGDLDKGFEVQLPNEDGPVKIYVLVKDPYNNVGIASTGIIVQDEAAKNRKYLVPKADLPFYVYKDGENMPYAPSAYMGNYQAISVETQQEEEVYSGTSALKITYDYHYNWYGLGLVDPANDWGDILGGYDLSGATTFSFWAKASKNKLTATIGFGLIGRDKDFPDTAKESIEIKLGTKWKKYTINLKKLDLSCIRSGFTLFSASYGEGHDIFIDEIVFE